MKDVSVSKIFGKAWELFKEHAGDLLVIAFVYLVISCLISALDTFNGSDYSFVGLVVSIACGIAQMIIALGFYRITLNTVDGEKPQLADLFNDREPTLVLHYILGTIIAVVAVLIGLFFLIIPGIYLAIRFCFFAFVLLEQEEHNCIKALETSWKMTEGHMLDLFALGILTFFIGLAGIIALFVGLFVAIPVVGLMIALAYRILSVRIQEKLPLNL